MYRELIDETALRDLLARLIAIESINPQYPGATTGEDRLAAFIASYLRDHGIDCELVEVFPGRPNLLARIAGNGSASGGLCLEAHMDTVGVAGYLGDPFAPVIRDNRMYGRGSCDTKGCMAAMLIALITMTRHGLAPATDLLFAATVDEENGFGGVTHLLEQGYRAAAAIVGEPTSNEVVVACKGSCRWQISSHGVSGHSSRPQEGHNAVYDMAALILKTEQTLIPSLKLRHHPLLGAPTTSVGVIHGGSVANVIPDRCTVTVDRRLIPGDDWPSIQSEWQELIAAVEQERPGARFSMTDPLVFSLPMATDTEHPLVHAALNMRAALDRPQSGRACSAKNTGDMLDAATHQARGVDYGCDASKFAPAGFASVVFGPGDIMQAHTVEEWIDLDDLVPATAWYMGMLCSNTV